jgi:hypothetical protein
MSRRRSQFASPVADPDFCRFARAILCRARRAARCVPDANCERHIVQDIASLRSATLWRDALSRSLQYSRIICAGSCSRPNSRFTVDLETAKALGLTVPNTLLVTVRSVVSSVRRDFSFAIKSRHPLAPAVTTQRVRLGLLGHTRHVRFTPIATEHRTLN